MGRRGVGEGAKTVGNRISRRLLLAGMAAMGASMMSDRIATAAGPGRFFARHGLSPGLQLYTLGDEAGRDLDATFAQVAAIGYRDVELPNLYGRAPAQIRAAADRAGLSISSLHLYAIGGPMGEKMGLSLLSEPSKIADSLGALGARHAVLPLVLLPDDVHPQPGEGPADMLSRVTVAGGEDVWKRTAALLNEKAAALKPLGIELAYHNHNLEFAPVGKTTGWAILARETDPGLVRFEVDTGWVSAAGLDPAVFLGGLRGRVSQVHVKDLTTGSPKNYAIHADCTEVGAGRLDWAKILPAAYAAGARHFYVEQEPPFALPRIESARRSYDFLAKLEA
jgi:sugar phosphate isomerase/epimerase